MEFPMSVISGANTDSITYPGISKLYWGQQTITKDTNHPPKRRKLVNVAKGKHVTLTILHKLEILWGLWP